MKLRFFGPALVLGGVLLSSPTSLRADSDGYFCSGPGYLAYELAFSFGVHEHVLYIVSLSDSAGIGHPATVALPRFQVHGMRCDSGAVALLGWDFLYTVRFGQVDTSLVASVASTPHPVVWRRALPGYAGGNLGALSRARPGRPDTVDLGIVGALHRFVLVMHCESHGKNRCSCMLRTRIVQVDRARRTVQVVTLLEGKVYRECGE